MSLHFSLEQMTRLREATRLLATRAADHEHGLQSLLASVELDMRDGSDEPSARRTGAVRLARQLCLDAREQQIALEQVIVDLGADLPADRPRSPVVLVADGYPEHREWLLNLLNEAGFLVRTVTNGLEAVIAAHQLRPAVILMDLGLPVLDGIEATRLIKAIDELRAARVIALSPEPVDRPSFNSELFAAILPKPSTPDQVLATVQRWVHEPSAPPDGPAHERP